MQVLRKEMKALFSRLRLLRSSRFSASLFAGGLLYLHTHK